MGGGEETKDGGKEERGQETSGPRGDHDEDASSQNQGTAARQQGDGVLRATVARATEARRIQGTSGQPANRDNAAP